MAWVVCTNTSSVPIFYVGTKVKAKLKFDFQTKTNKPFYTWHPECMPMAP